MRLSSFAFSFVLSGLLVSPALAVTTSYSTVPISQAAITSDSALASSVANRLIVTVPAGADWTNTSIRVTLTSGSVYNNAFDTSGTANQAFWALVPALEFDSYVNGKNLGSVAITGGLDANGQSSPTSAGLTGAGQTVISAAFGSTTTGEDGTFSIANLTFSNNAQGTFFGRSFDTTAPGVPITFSGTIVNGAVVPEPASAAVATIAAASLLVRRRRRA